MTHLTDLKLQEIGGCSIADVPKEILDHVARCDRCRFEWQTYRILFTALSEPPQEALSASFVGDVMNRIEKEKARSFDFLEWALLALIIVMGIPILIHYVDWGFIFEGLRERIRGFGENSESPVGGGWLILLDSKVYLILIAAAILAAFDRIEKILLRHRN